MTPRQALAFVRKHGIVLESARGAAPSLAEAVAGEPIRGSWWSHRRGPEIFVVTRAVRDSDHVLVCRVIQGKITYVHRRLWPALVRLADRFPRKHLAQIMEVHTPAGRHLAKTIPFPKWVPVKVASAAARLKESSALRALGLARS